MKFNFIITLQCVQGQIIKITNFVPVPHTSGKKSCSYDTTNPKVTDMIVTWNQTQNSKHIKKRAANKNNGMDY